MVTDLQTKVEKYETKAARCEERARQATDGPQRAFYEVLAHYYGEVATDFRQVIEKRRSSGGTPSLLPWSSWDALTPPERIGAPIHS